MSRPRTSLPITLLVTAVVAGLLTLSPAAPSRAAPAAADSLRYYMEEDGHGVGWFSLSKTTDAQGRIVYSGSGLKTDAFKYRKFELVVGPDFMPVSSFVRASAGGQGFEIATTYAKGKVISQAKVNGGKQPIPEGRIDGLTFILPSSVWSAMGVLSDYLAKVDAATYRADLKAYDPLSTLDIAMKVAGQGKVTVTTGSAKTEVRSFGLTYKIQARHQGTQTVELTLYQNLDGSFFGYEVPGQDHRAYPFPSDAKIVEAPKPFPEVPVSFVSAGDTLKGSLMLPLPNAARPGPPPAVVFVSGSGPSDRDETVFGFHVFRTLAEKLAGAGYASLRYDDRGVEESGGDYNSSSTETFAQDAAAAVAAVRSRPEVDGSKVGLIGHSEGAMLAPEISALCEKQTGKPAWCVVLMAGSTSTGREINLEQQEHGLALSDWSDEVKAKKRQLQLKLLDYIDGKTDWPTVKALADSEEAQSLEMQKGMVDGPWFRSFLNYDPKPWVKQLKVPVLVMGGELDTQLPPHHSAALRDSLRAAGNKNVSYAPARGINHLFQKATTGEVSEYATLKKEFAPGIPERIVAFLAMCERMP
jgi:pimeloyl-ACP methyl ester carboxylesterase